MNRRTLGRILAWLLVYLHAAGVGILGAVALLYPTLEFLSLFVGAAACLGVSLFWAWEDETD